MKFWHKIIEKNSEKINRCLKSNISKAKQSEAITESITVILPLRVSQADQYELASLCS